MPEVAPSIRLRIGAARATGFMGRDPGREAGPGRGAPPRRPDRRCPCGPRPASSLHDQFPFNSNQLLGAGGCINVSVITTARRSMRSIAGCSGRQQQQQPPHAHCSPATSRLASLASLASPASPAPLAPRFGVCLVRLWRRRASATRNYAKIDCSATHLARYANR